MPSREIQRVSVNRFQLEYLCGFRLWDWWNLMFVCVIYFIKSISWRESSRCSWTDLTCGCDPETLPLFNSTEWQKDENACCNLWLVCVIKWSAFIAQTICLYRILTMIYVSQVVLWEWRSVWRHTDSHHPLLRHSTVTVQVSRCAHTKPRSRLHFSSTDSSQWFLIKSLK